MLPEAFDVTAVAQRLRKRAEEAGVAQADIKAAGALETETEIAELMKLIRNLSPAEDQDSKFAELKQFEIVRRARENPDVWKKEDSVIENLEARDGWDRTPLYVTVMNGHYDTAELLISAKAVSLVPLQPS